MTVRPSARRAGDPLSHAGATLSRSGADHVHAPVRSSGGVGDGATLTTTTASESRALLHRSEVRRVQALVSLDGEAQTRLGQFFTPERAATLIADLPGLPTSGRLRVLDPGAGSGALSAAIAARVLRESPNLELEIVAVELDEAVARVLCETLADIGQTFAAAGFKAQGHAVIGDYIELSTSLLRRNETLSDQFDLVIMNPPYMKLTSSSAYRRALAVRGAECPNLYAAFLALGVDALASGGQLVAITPRSFANGPYFGQFRGYVLDRLALDRLHVFESRSTVFSDTGVLQENIIFSGTRDGQRDNVTVSVSKGHLDESLDRVVTYADVVRPGDSDRFIRILSDDNDTSAAETMATMPATLTDLGIRVSTGRVVDFRSRECLTSFDEAGAYPLIYPGNVRSGIVEWPRQLNKAQGFVSWSDKDSKLLLPPGYYVIIKRFSAKEERRRVVAAVWDPEAVAGPVAFENHLNVIHADGGGLERDLAIGLSYWLNSTLVDLFFRTFSGHTQVNASDLRSLRFPKLDDLRVLGQGRSAQLPTQIEIDQLTTDVLGLRGLAA